MKKWVMLTFLIMFLSISGCVEEEQSASSKNIELAASLMSSGEELIEEMDSEYPTDGRNRLYAAKISYEEALEILADTTTEDEEELKSIEVNKAICIYYLESIEAQEYLADCYEHLSKSRAYIYVDNYEKAREELTLFKTAINSANPNLKNAKETSNEIDMDEVPLELKPILILDRETLYNNLDQVSELEDLQISLYSQVDGFENFDKALVHVEEEEWNHAESKFNYTVSNLSRSRDILFDLQESQYTEIAVPAIESAGAYNATITFSEHCALACGYMADGRERKADEEFELALEVFE